ncbi:ERF family protein [Streptomyces sp. NPDC087228]|uniref:ERF family protein n=1 Tax=Streptomyces sp. NPDC087228 TaxID=3365772 RepID=UPI00380F67A9
MTVTAIHPAAHAAPVEPTPPALPAVETTYEPAPHGAPADAPRVFAAINSVMRDAMPVAKSQRNTQQNYQFRGIDDAMSAMAGPMRAHGVFILPTIASHRQERRGEKMTHTVIRMRYRIYGPAGDCLVADVPGEASDFADKATNKAQSAALKYLLFTLFMLPVDARSIDDSDRPDDRAVQPTEQHRAERQQTQQRRQQRQQRQQQNGQARRSNQADPGPWEQQPQQQAPPQRRPDYLAAAKKAGSREEFGKIRAAAVQAGAPADYLAQLDAVAARKGAQPQRGGAYVIDPSVVRVEQPPATQQAPAPAPGPVLEPAAADDGYRTGPTDDEQAFEAEQRLRLAASNANLPTLDRDFEMVYGLPIEQATAAQLDTFRQRIEAAGGAQ